PLGFNITATDLNAGDTLTFYGDDLPSFVELNKTADATATITVTAQEGDAGLYTFPVRVSDGIYQDSTLVFLVVKNAGAADEAPVFNPVSPVVLMQDASTDVSLKVTDTDSFTVNIALAADAPD